MKGKTSEYLSTKNIIYDFMSNCSSGKITLKVSSLNDRSRWHSSFHIVWMCTMSMKALSSWLSCGALLKLFKYDHVIVSLISAYVGFWLLGLAKYSGLALTEYNVFNRLKYTYIWKTLEICLLWTTFTTVCVFYT